MAEFDIVPHCDLGGMCLYVKLLVNLEKYFRFCCLYYGYEVFFWLSKTLQTLKHFAGLQNNVHCGSHFGYEYFTLFLLYSETLQSTLTVLTLLMLICAKNQFKTYRTESYTFT